MNRLYLLNTFLCILILPFKAVTQEKHNEETIFIVFEGSKFEKHKKNYDDRYIYGEYMFLVPEKTNDSSGLNNTGVITLTDKKYKDFDASFSNNPLPRFRIHKSFLRKNKRQILSIKEMRQMGFNKIFHIFLKAKHIFLIDKQEAEGNLITVKEVEHFYIGEE